MHPTLPCTVLIAIALDARAAPAADQFKVYISADMEGVAGVVTEQQLGPDGFEYPRFREFMTNEVNAAIAAAQQAGATEILVSDSHGNGQNLLIENLPPAVQLVRSWPRPLMMMEGIDATFDAVMFIGYHAATNSSSGVRAHTISSARLTDVRLNGTSVPEAGINAAIAGSFGVPVVLITGDDAAVREATTLLGDVEGAVVKWALGFHAARSLTPAAACELIRDRAARALARRRDFKPFKVPAPIELTLSFKNYRPVELLSYLPIVQRTDSHTVKVRSATMIEASKFIEFAMNYSPDLAP
ncbi:MAG: M55 family metallopeptidase [Planctomycetota bacterium]